MAYLNTDTGVAVNEYLYSDIGTAFDSATLADGSITADADGNKFLQKGTVLAKIISGVDSGKVGPYALAATDGRQTAGNIVGISDRYMDVTEGDMEVGYLYAGTATEDRVWCDGVQGSLSADVKAALRGASIDILLR
jgi:hypothetical protein